MWDSGTTNMASTTQGQRSPDISYAGSALASSTTYYWRIKFSDAAGATGDWSTTTASFILASGSSTPTTATFYATQTGDGELYAGGAGWDTQHDATSGTEDDDSTTASVYAEAAGSYWLARLALPFDTSALPDDATITGATLYVYPTTKWDVDTNGAVRVVQNTTASATSLNADDYDQIGSINDPAAGATDSDITGISTGSYLSIPLNATGLSWISKTGVTKLGLRESHDATDSAPASGLNGIRISTADETGTAQDPKLEITYTTAGGGGGTSTPLNINGMQDISYTYDKLGNITQIVDRSETKSAATTTYAYDDLSRLTSASTTNATTTPYSRTYTYNAIGNISSASDLGNYTYAGTNYANPHAVTSVNGSTYTYDNAGNVTADGVRTNTWDYRNQLTRTVKASTTYRYLYDQGGQRTAYFDGVASTTYPNKYYDVRNNTKTKHIYAGDELVASIEGNGIATTTNTIHLDHLGGTNVVTNVSGAVVQTLAYYPFGVSRVDEKYGTFDESRKYTGHEYDEQTSLYYMNARYQNPSVGRFVSQDPAFWSLPAAVLVNPQKLNSYTYADNNPVTMVDPTGQFGVVGAGIGAVVGAGFGILDAHATGGSYFWGAVKGGAGGAAAGFSGAYVQILAGGSFIAAASIAEDLLSGTKSVNPTDVMYDVRDNIGSSIAAVPYQALKTTSRLGRLLLDGTGMVTGEMVGLGMSVSRNQGAVTLTTPSIVTTPTGGGGSWGSSSSNSGSSNKTSASKGGTSSSSSSGSSSSVNWSAVQTAVKLYYSSGGK